MPSDVQHNTWITQRLSGAKCFKLMKEKINFLATNTKCKAGKKKSEVSGEERTRCKALNIGVDVLCFGVMWQPEAYKAQALLTAHIWTCHSMKSTGVTNNINNYSVPSGFQYTTPESQHAQLQGLGPETPTNGMQP